VAMPAAPNGVKARAAGLLSRLGDAPPPASQDKQG